MSFPRFLSLFLIISSLGYSYKALANKVDTIGETDLSTLHTHPRWLKLLHYKVTNSSQKSLVNDQSFFLSSTGKTSAKNELKESIKLFSQNTNEAAKARCQFPARIKFLEKHLKISLKKPSDKCNAFNDWHKENLVDDVWLIFPSAYLNSPSSMFGHTLLRLDKSNEKGTVLTSSAVNYAATVNDQENGILYAFKGLFGGYPGYFSMQPYYKKVKEYSRMENRDIWEYKLNLTEEEIDWLVLHLWELNEIKFDYYFTTQNCSYQLLTLLEVLRPEQKLTANFETVAIPVDTVRELNKNNWIEHSVYRASKATEFYQSIDTLDQTQKALVATIKTSNVESFIKQLEGYSDNEKIIIINAAHKLLRLSKETKNKNSKSLQLLKYRSRLGILKEPTIVTTPEVSPEKGHASSRFSIGTKHAQDDTSLFLDYKATYHGLDDSISGFAEGAQINFLHFQGEFFNDQFKLEKFDLLDIRSLSTSDQFIDRLAWQVNTGLKRTLFKDKKRKLTEQFNAQLGKTYNVGKLKWYALLGGHFVHSDQYKHHYQVGPNAISGIFFQGKNYATELSIRSDYFIEEETSRESLIWSNSWHIDKNLSLGAELKSEKYDDDYYNSATLKISAFF